MSDSQNEAKLRHEFVGMMFAVTIGEVGLQTAPLVHTGCGVYFLPAYTHLILAAIVIAASWVGWTLSVAPGARNDVKKIFQWEFIVLLVDVALVICYFILVRTVNFAPGERPFIAPASTVAKWIAVIFALYFVWDIVTKIIIFRSAKRVYLETGTWNRQKKIWFRNNGTRMLPTILCCILGWATWRLTARADSVHAITADLALLCLVLFFRASKEWVSAQWLRVPHPRRLPNKRWARIASVACLLFFAISLVWTHYSLPLPNSLVTAITPKLGLQGSCPSNPLDIDRKPSGESEKH